jgi:hypothetical protein
VREGRDRDFWVYDLHADSDTVSASTQRRMKHETTLNDSHLVLQAILGRVLSLDLVLDAEVEISRVPRVCLAREDTGDLVALLQKHGPI